jgi:sigma-B regulation protein RsbU (phosphoserine phosphatase)
MKRAAKPKPTKRTGAPRRASPSQPAVPARPQIVRPKLDLSKTRHDLRTPINHILGYCEMLQEDEQLPDLFAPDLEKIHAGGRQLLALIAEYFDEETFETKRGDVHRLCHDLRTPVNQIIGYSEILQEEAEETGRKKYLPDLRKIREAALSWLGLMEEHLLPTGAGTDATSAFPFDLTGSRILPPGITFQSPSSRNATRTQAVQGRLLVVDDDESNRDMLGRRLQRDGYTVQLAANGVEALRLLRTSPYDLVLLDLIMSGLDGYQVLLKMKSDPVLREVPVIMLSALDQEGGIARCIELGAEDYVSKPFSPVFLRARIEASLEKKRLRDKERQTYTALLASEKRLAAELADAAGYVRSLLPAPIEGDVRAQWRFQPSAELGGDIFGYHWINPDKLAIYLLDVSGHGVGAALLSVSVFNVLRTQSLQGTDFADPAAVLQQLNRVFPMERQNNLLFTIWYGVFDRTNRRLTYSSGGHPPAVLTADATDPVQQLGTGGRLLGCDPTAEFRNESCVVKPGSHLYVFSDGAYEIARPDGRTAQLADLIQQLGLPVPPSSSKLDELLKWAQVTGGQSSFKDDVSILEIIL